MSIALHSASRGGQPPGEIHIDTKSHSEVLSRNVDAGAQGIHTYGLSAKLNWRPECCCSCRTVITVVPSTSAEGLHDINEKPPAPVARVNT